jgi:CBS domain-containing protein
MAPPVQLQKAFLTTEGGQKIECMFNPERFAFSMSNRWEPSRVPGKSAPGLRFAGGESGSFSLSLMFDTTADGVSVTTHTNKLLKLMEVDDAEDVRELLAYPEDSAGGIMNTEFFAVRPHMAAKEVVEVLRQKADEIEIIYDVYVVDSENHLVGVFSLRDLVLARPDAQVSDFMHRRVATVNILDSQDQVAHAVAKYNLHALPVVDDQNRIHGIVTADDALDKLIPTAWKKRLPRMYR